MPICPSCGKTFSGFSFGPNPAVKCADCSKTEADAAAARTVATMAQLPHVVVRRLPLPALTLGIIAANALVYVAMTVSGVSWIEPNIRDAVKWGADFGPLTLSSDWWRLLTSTFVHFGIIHIALNMWCLWNLGTTLEPFMGRKVFGVMYFASGLAASLVSVAWNPWRVSAGASGAIFGVAGALVSYLALKKTPMDRALVRKNLKSLGVFIFYNLLYGVRGGVDNSAHLGGLVAGLILGAAIPPMVLTSAGPQYVPVGPPDLAVEAAKETRATRVAFAAAAFSAVFLLLGFAALRAKRISVARYGAAVKLIKAGNNAAAAARLQESVKLDPDSILATEMQGELLLQQGRAAEAVAPLEKAIALEPDAYDAQHNLALAYVSTGRAVDALLLINRSITSQRAGQQSAWWGSFFVRSISEAETTEYPLAKADLQTVIAAKPDLTEAKEALAQIPDARAPAAKPQIQIPYAKLVMQSEYWPLYP